MMSKRKLSLGLLLVAIACADRTTTPDLDDNGAESGGTSAIGGDKPVSSGGSVNSSGAQSSVESGGSLSLGGSPKTSGGASVTGGTGTGGDGPVGGSGGQTTPDPVGLSWPIDCIPLETCVNVGAPDIDNDGIAFDCEEPGYQGHEGTDIGITWEQMDEGVSVRAAADGEVFFVSDGKFDRCPAEGEADCLNPPSFEAGAHEGTTVCTELGPYCKSGSGSCFWCFAGGNVIVVLHDGVPGVFATRYDHLKKNSVLVKPGDRVTRGQVIAQVGSAGNSTGPHLHFEVWGATYYDLVEPWAGPCGPNEGPSLWANSPPWPE